MCVAACRVLGLQSEMDILVSATLTNPSDDDERKTRTRWRRLCIDEIVCGDTNEGKKGTTSVAKQIQVETTTGLFESALTINRQLVKKYFFLHLPRAPVYAGFSAGRKFRPVKQVFQNDVLCPAVAPADLHPIQQAV